MKKFFTTLADDRRTYARAIWILNCGLKITIEANKKTVNFLDVTLNLSDGKYMAYTKPGNIPLYVNKKSNHPPRIIENIPKSINKRLSEISIDEHSFNEAAPLYQKALDDSGYNHRLAFTPSITQSSFGTTHLLARRWLQTLDERSLRSSTKSSLKVMYYTKSSTATQ